MAGGTLHSKVAGKRKKEGTDLGSIFWASYGNGRTIHKQNRILLSLYQK